MPSFSRETIEEWRRERISQSKIPKDLDEWQLKTTLGTCEQDLAAEEFNLRLALLAVKEHRKNIRSLKKKHANILKRMGV